MKNILAILGGIWILNFIAKITGNNLGDWVLMAAAFFGFLWPFALIAWLIWGIA